MIIRKTSIRIAIMSLALFSLSFLRPASSQGAVEHRLFNHASFQPKTTITRDIRVNMPRQPGLYTVQIKIGTFPLSVVDTRWFTVDVKP